MASSSLGYRTQSEQFSVYFPQNSALAFENGDQFVWITVSSGNMNSSNARCYVDNGGGFYRFVSNESVTLYITFNVTNLKVNNLMLTSGSSRSFVQNDTVIIEWNISYRPYLPLKFLLGMAGVAGLFAGPLYVVYNLKKKRITQEVFVNGTIIISICVGLFLTWLWG